MFCVQENLFSSFSKTQFRKTANNQTFSVLFSVPSAWHYSSTRSSGKCLKQIFQNTSRNCKKNQTLWFTLLHQTLWFTLLHQTLWFTLLHQSLWFTFLRICFSKTTKIKKQQAESDGPKSLKTLLELKRNCQITIQ